MDKTTHQRKPASNAKPAKNEAPSFAEAELTEEQLDTAVGGTKNASSSTLYEACSTGTHIKSVKITS